MSDDDQIIRQLAYVTNRKLKAEPNKRRQNQIIKAAIKEAYIFGKAQDKAFFRA